jgi:hypothetical protein
MKAMSIIRLLTNRVADPAGKLFTVKKVKRGGKNIYITAHIYYC